MIDRQVRELGRFNIPLRNVEIRLEEVRYEGGMAMLQLKIREGRRFTILELDADTARHWGQAMAAWAGTIDPDTGKPAESGTQD